MLNNIRCKYIKNTTITILETLINTILKYAGFCGLVFIYKFTSSKQSNALVKFFMYQFMVIVELFKDFRFIPILYTAEDIFFYTALYIFC